jgi:hypothetical protein
LSDSQGDLDFVGKAKMYVFLIFILNDRGHLENMCVDKRIILKCVLNKQNERMCTGLIWLRVGESGGSLLRW